MKNIIFFITGLVLVTLLTVGFANGIKADNDTATQSSVSAAVAPAGIAYSYPGTTTFTTDTITNTESDTLLIPTNLLSDLSYAWYVTSTELSGTLDLTITVQESNTIGGTPADWVAVASGTSVSADGTIRIVGDRVYGTQQRIIITGAGTQSAEYVLNARFKKTR